MKSHRPLIALISLLFIFALVATPAHLRREFHASATTCQIFLTLDLFYDHFQSKLEHH